MKEAKQYFKHKKIPSNYFKKVLYYNNRDGLVYLTEDILTSMKLEQLVNLQAQIKNEINKKAKNYVLKGEMRLDE